MSSFVWQDLFAISQDQPFRFPSTFTFVIRAFSTLEGTLSHPFFFLKTLDKFHHLCFYMVLQVLVTFLTQIFPLWKLRLLMLRFLPLLAILLSSLLYHYVNAHHEHRWKKQELLDLKQRQRSGTQLVQEIRKQADDVIMLSALISFPISLFSLFVLIQLQNTVQARSSTLSMPYRVQRIEEFVKELDSGDLKLRVRVLEVYIHIQTPQKSELTYK